MIANAFPRAEAGALIPLQYLEIIPALPIGRFVFGDFPDRLTWVGTAIIIGAGTYVFYRERQLARRLAKPGESRMVWRHLATLAAMLGLTGALAGCDDASISPLGRRTFLDAGDLAALQEASGLLVEIHGAAWPGAVPDELASTLRMPEGPAKQVRFRAVPPGAWVIGSGERLVLHFNPVGAPNSNADCRATEEIATTPPARQGFTVNATFCKGKDWLIRAYLKAGAVETDDWLDYVLVMRKLLGKLFPKP